MLRFIKGLFSGFSLFVILFLLYTVVIEPRLLLDVQGEEAPVPGLPTAWEGQQIAFLADFQVGMWWDNTGMVEKAIDEIIERKPAMTLIGGDFIYKADTAQARQAISYVRPLVEAGIPTYAVLGNHDYSMMKKSSEVNTQIAQFVVDRLTDAGVTVLRNEAVPLTREGGPPLYLAGLDSEWAGRADPGAALAGIPDGAPRIVLMHNPVTFSEFPPHAAPLALAGHTHGGQLRIPILPSESWLEIAEQREVIADGWSTEGDDVGAEGNRAYVTRGIGFSLVPMRMLCRPELTMITLRSAPLP